MFRKRTGHKYIININGKEIEGYSLGHNDYWTTKKGQRSIHTIYCNHAIYRVPITVYEDDWGVEQYECETVTGPQYVYANIPDLDYILGIISREEYLKKTLFIEADRGLDVED